MLEFRLYDVVEAGTNARGEMGRVVVPSPETSKLKAQETGKFFLCCNRIFLTIDRFKLHKTTDCRNTPGSANHDNKQPLIERIRQVCSVNKDKTDEKRYSCTVVDLGSLIRRRLLPTGTDFFKCRKCSFNSVHLQTIAKHVKQTHAQDLQPRNEIIQGPLDEQSDEDGDDDHDRPSRYYKCDMCSFYKTTYKSNIVLHKRRAHIPNGGFPCTHCTCCYETQVGITLHLHRVHGLKVDLGNKNDKKTDPHNQATKSTFGDKGKSPSITKPGLKADWTHQAASSNKMNNSQNSLSFSKCEFCPMLFDTKNQLIEHHREQHLDRKGSSESRTHQQSSKKASPVIMKNGSTAEGAKFPGIAKTFKTVTFEGLSKKLYQTTKMASVIPVSEKTSNRAGICCNMCEFIAKDKLDLDFHLRKAHVVFGVECECGCSFATATELTNHKINQCSRRKDKEMPIHVTTIKQEPSEVKNDTCECGKSFGSIRRLNKHKEICTYDPTTRMDVENKSNLVGTRKSVTKETTSSHEVQCPHCKKYCKNDMGLRTHVFQMHAKVMCAFDVCEICKYRTHNYNNYKMHKKTCHVKGGIKCPVSSCLCSFKSIEGVTSHCMQLHKQKLDRTTLEMKCKYCEFIGFTSSDMEKHCLKGHDNALKGINKMLCCELCDYQTGLKGFLQRHIEKNHVENGLQCDFCNNKFSSENGLRSHTNMMHPNSTADNFSTCKLCGYHTGNKRAYKEHYERCHVGPYKCLECVCCFKHIDGLSKHTLVLHKKKLDKTAYLLKCSYSNCGYTTYLRGSLRHHETTQHLEQEHNAQQEEKQQRVKCPFCGIITSCFDNHLSTSHVEGGFPCPENCNCSFRTTIGLHRHMKLKHGKILSFKKERDPVEFPIKCSKCEFRCRGMEGLNKHSIKMHGFLIPQVKTNRECPICHVKITETLSSHKKRYHVQNGFKCLQKECPCSFETNMSRVLHMKKAHQITIIKRCRICKLKLLGTFADHMQRCHVENGLKCEHDDCPCTFETEMGMRVHLRTQHSQQSTKKSISCHLCGHALTQKLERHLERSHVKNGLPCSFCCCSFETEQGRSQHMKYRHNITMSKNCTLCGITPVVSMNKHLQQSHVTGGLPCSRCSCTFGTEMAKTRHLARYHNVMKKRLPKICSLCNLAINITLEKHRRIHHVQNGYECVYCKWSLPSKSGLARHMLKVHNKSVVKTINGPTLIEERITIERCNAQRNHSSTNTFKCSFCPSKFSSKSGRTRHCLCRHKVSHAKKSSTNQLPSSMISSQNPSASRKSPAPTPTGIVDSTDSTNKVHIQKVEENSASPSKEQLTCTRCGYLATSKSHLNIHLQKSHVKNTPYMCKFCSCSYASDKELHRHQKVFH